MSAENSDHYYNYKSVFQIWKESKNFERQNILMSRPPLDLTPFFTNTKNAKVPHLDLTPVSTKMPDPKPLTRPTESSKRNGIEHVPEDPESDPSSSDSL